MELKTHYSTHGFSTIAVCQSCRSLNQSTPSCSHSCAAALLNWNHLPDPQTTTEQRKNRKTILLEQPERVEQRGARVLTRIPSTAKLRIIEIVASVAALMAGGGTKERWDCVWGFPWPQAHLLHRREMRQQGLLLIVAPPLLPAELPASLCLSSMSPISKTALACDN